jgi:hypothetical protein
MWSSVFAVSLVLGLLPPLDIRTPIHLFQDKGALLPQQQRIALLPHTRKDLYLSVAATGDGQNGDLDCYLIQNHRVIAKDEGNNNQCHLSVRLKTDQPVNLWYVNHGTSYVNYQIVVDQ